MLNKGLVSIVVPVYNVEEYIERCLISLVNQTYQNIEIIVVNDGSPDKSQEIIDQFEKEYSCVKSYQKTNGGLSDARNFGMTHAIGEYIAFIDSDDYVDSHMYEELVRKAIEEKADIVECDLYHTFDSKESKEIGLRIYDKHKMIRIGRSVVWNKLYRKKWLDETKVQFSCGLIYEDVEFFMKLVPFINKYAYVDDVFVHYVQRPQSLNNKSSKKTADIFQILENIKKFYQKNGFYSNYKDDLEFLFARILLCSSFRRISKVPDKELRSKLLKMNYRVLEDNYPYWKKNKYVRSYGGKHGFFMRTINWYTYSFYSILFSLLK